MPGSVVQGNAEADSRSDLRIYPLGSGSDYTPFIQHLGIASLNLGFGGENGGGGYHSIYDTFEQYTRFGDPGFAYGVTLANVTGRAVLRFANADILPYSFSGYVDNVARYADEVQQLAVSTRKETERINHLIETEAYRLAADPEKTYHPPSKKDPVPYFNFAPLQNAMERLKQEAHAYDQALMEHGMQRDGSQQEAINEILIGMEQLMTIEDGLPRRPWFRHQIYAPGFYTGYGVKTLPGIREAIEQRDWEEASEQIVLVSETINRVADGIAEAKSIFGQ